MLCISDTLSMRFLRLCCKASVACFKGHIMVEVSCAKGHGLSQKYPDIQPVDVSKSGSAAKFCAWPQRFHVPAMHVPWCLLALANLCSVTLRRSQKSQDPFKS